MASLLAAAAERRIAVIGDAMVDIYLLGEVERISPEAPVPVVRIRERRVAIGGAANVAQNVAALGAHPSLLATIGRDENGRLLREMLNSIAGDGTALVEINRPTTTKTRVLARLQQVVRFDEEEDSEIAKEELERVLEAVENVISTADALILEDYNKGMLAPAVIQRAIALAKSKNIPIVVDPKYRNFFAFKGTTVFKPNRRELEAALGAAVDLDHPEALPAALERLGVEHLLLTLGERGMVLVARSGSVQRIPTTAREVYDVVGAGDTVTAYLAAMLAAGATPAQAAAIANFAAGVEVGKLGAATVSAVEVLAAYDDFAERTEQK
ncbi:MAG: bifunctional hydroxymethylpyrimidine kinase/phosphomethylpyrimidine kinase [Anaerolineae bacterium]|nr:bifunctional hydroxymethylpyrimidine kinase/phosphomethylpyrimidine kinase [Gemmatimonadaceae bacterium]